MCLISRVPQGLGRECLQRLCLAIIVGPGYFFSKLVHGKVEMSFWFNLHGGLWTSAAGAQVYSAGLLLHNGYSVAENMDRTFLLLLTTVFKPKYLPTIYIYQTTVHPLISLSLYSHLDIKRRYSSLILVTTSALGTPYSSRP